MEEKMNKDTETVTETKTEEVSENVTEGKKKKSTGKIILTVLLVILLILTLCGVGAYFLARNFVVETLETIGVYTEEAQEVQEVFERAEDEMEDLYYDYEAEVEEEEDVFSIEWVQGDPLEDERDGQVYSTVILGNQTWMQENLNVGEMVERDEVENLGSSCEDIKKFCYEDGALNCDAFGGLYQWEQVMCGNNRAGSQGICPDGWYVPTDDDWKELEEFLGMRESDIESTNWRDIIGHGDTGKSLKDDSEWNGTNASGFEALPVGFVRDSGSFAGLTDRTYFWTSSTFGQKAWYRGLQSDYAGIFRSNDDLDSFVSYSLRCIQK